MTEKALMCSSGVDPCGENGEFHSFVYKGPLFENPVQFSLGEIVLRDSFLFCDLVSEGPLEHADGSSVACPVRTANQVGGATCFDRVCGYSSC